MGKTVEIKASQYYIYRSYVSTYYYVYMRLEEWLKEIIFRNDESRTFLASDEYAFRRRFELTDTSKNYNDVEASSLQFPFANYWPLNTGWQPDTRIVANPAALVYAGIYEGDTKIRAASVSLPISITFYYDREDDARMAYEKLLFYTYNEHYYDIDVPYAGNTLGIPFILRVNNLRFNPTFNETDWLNKNRIFTISVEFDIRTYVLYPPEQPDYDVDLDADDASETPEFKAVEDDSFNTIAFAIKEGRRVYRNLQKVIQFLLAGNIAEITTLFAATLFNLPAPLLAVHILWVNLATATLPALALGVDPASKNIMKHKPVKSGTLFEKDLVRRVIIQGIFVAAMTTCAYWIGASMGGHVTGQTMAFCVLAFSQMLRAFNQRSNTEPIWVRAEGINPWLIVSFVVSALLMACILLVPALQNAFRLTLLDGTQWLIVIGLSLMSILQVEIVKTIKKHIHK